MYLYAYINEQNIVQFIATIDEKIEKEGFVLLTEEQEIELGSIYNSATGEFTSPVIEPTQPEGPTIQEKILAETQYQTSLLEMQLFGGE